MCLYTLSTVPFYIIWDILYILLFLDLIEMLLVLIAA